MNKALRVKTLLLGIVLTWIILPSTGSAGDKDKEEMMWRGVIMMEAVERHQFEIKESTDSSRRKQTRQDRREQRATIQVVSADPLRSGDIKVGGAIHVSFEKLTEDYFEGVKCRRWRRRTDRSRGSASANLMDSLVNISLARKSHIDSAKAIEQAVGRCGNDPKCLEGVYERFKGVVDDGSSSFPIKIVVQCIASCPGQIVQETIDKNQPKCKGGDARTDEDSHTLTTDLCLPMLIAMDGTYTRSREGDRITGFFSESEKVPYRGFDGKDYPIEKSVRCTVNLTNGPPEIRIYRLTEDQPPKDITDEEEKVLVGEMVRLQACVIGTGMGEEKDRKWEIPEKTIKSWAAYDDGPVREDVTEDDLKKGIVRFACVDGSTGGRNRTVTFRADFAKTELEGKTDLKVYEPKVDVLEFDYGDYVGLGAGCELTPGKGGDSLGLLWKNKVTLPRGFEERSHCTQMVQVVSGNNWFFKKMGFPNYEWFVRTLDKMLDTSYPYSGPAWGGKETVIGMKDSPGAPLSGMVSGYVEDSFQAYLMFKPGAVLDLGSVWVPLRRVEWAWKGAIVHEKNPDPYDREKVEKLPCEKRFRLIPGCIRPPASYNPQVMDTTEYPKWKERYDEEKHKPKQSFIVRQDFTELPPSGSGWSCP